VEDDRVVIASDIEASDFGDAPGTFPTTLAQDGARHRASPLMLGPRRDLEADSSADDNTVGVAEFHPQQRGFDDYFGFIESHHDYFDTGEPLAEQHDPILRGTVPLVETNCLTTAFARECVRFIQQHTNQPFLLYAPFNAIHFPLQATPNCSTGRRR
jgi:hypothetical protein